MAQRRDSQGRPHRESRPVRDRAVRKARAAALLASGESVAQTAELTGIAQPNVSARIQPIAPRAVMTDDRAEDVAELIQVYIIETLTTLVAHARMARDAEWFGKQTGRDIAIWDGIHLDKIESILRRASEVFGTPLDGGGEE